MDIIFKEIQNKVYDIGELINAPKELLFVSWQSPGDGTPHLEIEGSIFNYIYSERGFELFRKKASSLDELLYLIFDRVTSRMSMDYSMDNSGKGVYSKKLYFLKKIELMSKISAVWADRIKKEMDEVLNGESNAGAVKSKPSFLSKFFRKS